MDKVCFFFFFLISPYCSFHSMTFPISRPRSFTLALSFASAFSKSRLFTYEQGKAVEVSQPSERASEDDRRD